MDSLSPIVLNATYVTIADLCLAADLALEYQHTERVLLLRHEITSVTEVLNLVASVVRDTLPVHIYRAMLYPGIFTARLLRMARDTWRGQWSALTGLEPHPLQMTRIQPLLQQQEVRYYMP